MLVALRLALLRESLVLPRFTRGGRNCWIIRLPGCYRSWRRIFRCASQKPGCLEPFVGGPATLRESLLLPRFTRGGRNCWINKLPGCYCSSREIFRYASQKPGCLVRSAACAGQSTRSDISSSSIHPNFARSWLL